MEHNIYFTQFAPVCQYPCRRTDVRMAGYLSVVLGPLDGVAPEVPAEIDAQPPVGPFFAQVDIDGRQLVFHRLRSFLPSAGVFMILSFLPKDYNKNPLQFRNFRDIIES
ncbi:MAG: hypothetical protein FWE69_08685 [Clostridiales bacterium]|nr:hypothetical protein [Clostridiales bacterium]